jgi:hypothetical protein
MPRPDPLLPAGHQTAIANAEFLLNEFGLHPQSQPGFTAQITAEGMALRLDRLCREHRGIVDANKPASWR